MGPDERWLRAVTYLLPREFGDRVLQPAWDDLRFNELSDPGSTSRTGRLGRRLHLLLECLRLGLPQYLWCHGKPTRLARVVGTGVLVVAIVLKLLSRKYY